MEHLGNILAIRIHHSQRKCYLKWIRLKIMIIIKVNQAIYSLNKSN